jgi:hypothetical protein
VSSLVIFLFFFDLLWHLDQFMGISSPNTSSHVVFKDIADGVSMLLASLVRMVGIQLMSNPDSSFNC